ncbi:MAG: four helix bundle protein [Saprospiraceae bacterium]|nr:four helix bundle protein [Saprospiraceae bacterium]
MTNEEFNELFRKRTIIFALKVIEFLETVPFNSATRVLSFQICKSATSVGANFRAFCRGRSRNERHAKICIVVEEADESVYRLELFALAKYGDEKLLTWLTTESIELIKITTSIKHSMK